MENSMIFNAKRIISIGEEQSNSNLYMVVDFVLLDTLKNLNKIQYSEAFINDIKDNSESYAGIPLKVDFKKLVAGKTDKLTHNFNKKTQTFNNQMIGSFVKFYTQKNEDDILELCGQVRIPKEFEKACEVIQQLFDDNNLNVSYEIIVSEFLTLDDDTKYVDVAKGNYLFAYSIVSNPAVVSAKAMKLCAEMLDTDFINNENLEEGEMVERNKDMTMEQMFEKTKVHLSTEIAELDLNQIRKKLYNAIKGKFTDDYWNYDIIDQFPNYIVVQYWNTGDYYKLTYEVTDTEVTLSEPVKVTKNYVEIQEVDNVTIAELEKKVSELETEKTTLTATIATKDSLIAEKETALTNKDTEIASLNTKVTTLSESVISKDAELAELAPIKEAHATMLAEKNAAELVVKQTALKEKYSKVLSAEILTELAEAITALDESKLSAKVVEIAMAKATETKTEKKETLAGSRILDNVKISGSEDPTSLKAKYEI